MDSTLPLREIVIFREEASRGRGAPAPGMARVEYRAGISETVAVISVDKHPFDRDIRRLCQIPLCL